MVWFKVDDSFHSHGKALAASLEAVGLWTVAGSWSGDHLTDGFVPDRVVSLLSRGKTELADELVAAKLWKRAKGGYRFHEWTADADGTKRNPTRKVVKEERAKKADAGRKGGLASAKTRSKQQARAEADASGLLGDSFNPRPDPTNKNNPPTPQGGKNGSRRSYDYDTDPDFTKFWDVYPRKVGKPAAFKAWKAARKRGVAASTVIAAAERYRDNPNRKADYTKHPGPWINDERYDDFDELTDTSTGDAWWDN